MNVILTIVLAVQMLSAVVMVGLVLVQHGKGADMGAAFGGGGGRTTGLSNTFIGTNTGLVNTIGANNNFIISKIKMTFLEKVV